MSLALDHIFCFCSPALPEVRLLEDAGFTLTDGKRHHKQGTANRSVRFASNYLELIYLESEEDARANPLRLDLRAKWKDTGMSPFGIALKGEIPTENRSQFWEYRPPYLSTATILIHRFNELHPESPLLFVMPTTTGAADGASLSNVAPNKWGCSQISRATFQTPFATWPLKIKVDGLNFERSEHHKVEVQLDAAFRNNLMLSELLTLTSG